MTDTIREAVARAMEALETCLHRISRSNIQDFDTMHPDNCPQEARLALSYVAAIRAALRPAQDAPCQCGELREALAHAGNLISEFAEKYHDTDEETPQSTALRGIQAHIMGSLMEGDEALAASPPRTLEGK